MVTRYEFSIERRRRDHLSRRIAALNAMVRPAGRWQEKAYVCLKRNLDGLREDMIVASPAGVAEYAAAFQLFTEYLLEKPRFNIIRHLSDSVRDDLLGLTDTLRIMRLRYDVYSNEEERALEDARILIQNELSKLNCLRPA